MKSRFLQCVPCENLELEVANVEISIQDSMKNDLEKGPEKTWNFKVFELKKLICTGPEITPKSNKIM